MSLGGAASRGALVSSAAQWGRFVIQLASVAILARLISASDFGVVSMVTAIAGLAAVLGDFGLSLAAIQAKTLTGAQRSNLFWLNVAVGGAIYAVLIISAPWIATFYGQAEIRQVVLWLGVVFLINSAASQPRAELSRSLRFGALATADLTSQGIGLVVGVVLASFGAGYWALVAQQISTAFVALVIAFLQSRWWPSLPTRRADTAGLLRFGFNTTMVQVVNYLSSNVDSVALGRVWGSATLGYYDRAYQIFKMPLQQLAAPLTRVAVPILSRIEDGELYNHYIQRGQLALSYFVGGAFFVGIGLHAQIIELVLGPGWDRSKTIFMILLIGGVFQALGYVYYWVFVSKALTGLQLKYTVVSRLVMIGLILAGLPFGAIGVAVGATAGLFLNWLILTLLAVPRAGVSVPGLLRVALRPFSMWFTVAAICLLASNFLIGGLPNILQLLVLLAGMLVLIGLFVLIVPGYRKDLSVLTRTIRRGLGRSGR